jgi:hypothetical protein
MTDTSFEPIDVSIAGFVSPKSIYKPVNVKLLLRAAAELSAPFDFVRIDLYETTKGIFLGEFTFTPGAARDPFTDPSFSRSLLRQVNAISKAGRSLLGG